MRKFYQTKQFKELDSKWRKKLEKSGFPDIEDGKGNLKTYDRRTIAWDNRTRVSTFFTKLEAFLCDDDSLGRRQKRILKLYAEGARVTEISKRTHVTKRYVHYVITKTRRLILLE